MGNITGDAETLPARSAAAPLATKWPSEANTTSGVQLSTPDRASLQVKCTVTGPLFQPAKLAGGEAAPVMAGLVRSMLMPLTVALLLLPATSVAVPEALWPAPSLARVWLG